MAKRENASKKNRYHGVFAAKAKWRPRVVAYRRDVDDVSDERPTDCEHATP